MNSKYTGAEVEKILDDAKAAKNQIDSAQASAASSANSASASASSANDAASSAAQASNYLSQLNSAIQSLPDGQSVSEQVAENTVEIENRVDYNHTNEFIIKTNNSSTALGGYKNGYFYFMDGSELYRVLEGTNRPERVGTKYFDSMISGKGFEFIDDDRILTIRNYGRHAIYNITTDTIEQTLVNQSRPLYGWGATKIGNFVYLNNFWGCLRKIDDDFNLIEASGGNVYGQINYVDINGIYYMWNSHDAQWVRQNTETGIYELFFEDTTKRYQWYVILPYNSSKNIFVINAYNYGNQQCKILELNKNDFVNNKKMTIVHEYDAHMLNINIPGYFQLVREGSNWQEWVGKEGTVLFRKNSSSPDNYLLDNSKEACNYVCVGNNYALYKNVYSGILTMKRIKA